MANEKVNKVVLGNETLIDLTGDTVSANNLLAGATAHDASGERIQGNVSVPTVLDDLSDVNASSPASGDVLFRDGTEWINKNITRVVTKAQYDALVQAGTVDPDVNYFVTDMGVSSAVINDNAVGANTLWSSQKIASDLTSIYATGTTNTTGSTITARTYFYLNGTLVRALADIATNATFTEDTNYEIVTAGALNNNPLKWTLLDSKTGTTSINLPSEYTELFIKIDASALIFVNHLIKEIIGNDIILDGYWATGGYGGTASVIKTSTTIQLKQVFLSGSDITSSATITVYYR